jgi:hypothetical protein
MDSKPSLNLVLAAVSALYNNPNTTEKERASQWLGDLQKSVRSDTNPFTFPNPRFVGPRVDRRRRAAPPQARSGVMLLRSADDANENPPLVSRIADRRPRIVAKLAVGTHRPDQ